MRYTNRLLVGLLLLNMGKISVYEQIVIQNSKKI